MRACEMQFFTSLKLHRMISRPISDGERDRHEAAKLTNCEPRELSFTGVWSVYRTMLQGIEVRDQREWHDRLDRALRYASKETLPKRPGRSIPRAAYGRRPKTTHFQKRKKPEKPADTTEPKPK